jgi:hypothetical protein
MGAEPTAGLMIVFARMPRMCGGQSRMVRRRCNAQLGPTQNAHVQNAHVQNAHVRRRSVAVAGFRS